MYYFNYKIVIGSQRQTTKRQLKLKLNQTKPWCINCNQYNFEQNQKQVTHESNKLCMLQTGRKCHLKS